MSQDIWDERIKDLEMLIRGMKMQLDRIDRLERVRFISITAGMMRDLESKQKYLTVWEKGKIKLWRKKWLEEPEWLMDEADYEMLVQIYLKKAYRVS